jgi:hypothetical protein
MDARATGRDDGAKESSGQKRSVIVLTCSEPER